MKKLNRKEKLVLRRISLIFLGAVILAIPFILANELYFIKVLGWQSITFPMTVFVGMLVINLCGTLWLRLHNDDYTPSVPTNTDADKGKND